MNPIKKYFLNKELNALEYKIMRHYALSIRKTELETKQSNFISRMWNQYQHNHVVLEYELLSEQLSSIESRIHEIKDQLSFNT